MEMWNIQEEIMIVQEEAVGGETDTVSPVVKIKGLRSNFHAHS